MPSPVSGNSVHFLFSSVKSSPTVKNIHNYQSTNSEVLKENNYLQVLLIFCSQVKIEQSEVKGLFCGLLVRLLVRSGSI